MLFFLYVYIYIHSRICYCYNIIFSSSESLGNKDNILKTNTCLQVQLKKNYSSLVVFFSNKLNNWSLP